MTGSWSGQRTAFPPAIRRRILKRDPVCVLCRSKPSMIADHEPNYMTLLRMGVPDPHAPQYGQGVCQPCHDIKTRAEQRHGRARMNPRRAAPRHPSEVEPIVTTRRWW